VFYAGHVTPNCTLGPSERPSADTMKNCNLVSALKAKATFEKKQTTTVVAAVFDESEELDDESLDDMENEEYVDQSFSLPKHLWWMCCINAPATCAPTPVRALIDHGSTPVLISSEFANIMGLARCKLFKNLLVSGAFIDKSCNSDTATVLDEYCKLQLQSEDSVWKAHVVNTVVCPSLHTDIILGLDFLEKNKIVVDAELRTVIAKESNYDLLNPPPPIPLVPKTSPHHRRKLEVANLKWSFSKTHEFCRLVHTELDNLFRENPTQFNFNAYTTACPNVMGAICTHIEQLAGHRLLRSLDSKFKSLFSDHFPTDIPHADNLPKDVYHHIKIKPGIPISVGRAYSCPRKYRESWKMLIDQHAAASRIQPLSSPYASPSFIIPKADNTVLPRWVNNY
jgi:hypothetical protein